MQPDDKAHRIIHMSSRPERHCNARHTIRQIIETQQYPPKRSTVADIHIRHYNACHNRQKALYLDSHDWPPTKRTWLPEHTKQTTEVIFWADVTLANVDRYMHFRHRNKIFIIKTPINSQFSHQFWYFPLLKHDIIQKKINKLLNVYYTSINVYIKFYNRSSKGN